MARAMRYEVDSEASSDAGQTGESSQATDRGVILLGKFVKPSLSDIDFEPITDQEDGDSIDGGNSTDDDSFFKLIAGVTGDRIRYTYTDDDDDEEEEETPGIIYDEEAQKDAKINAASSTSGSSTSSMDSAWKGSKE